ncbi:hypothetical protein MFIFM68171_05486 [Madurella fahalii]|uniref:Uncharacterized protein n=1 Tax=Madurella fahalii TaxID=1157608 RepID=A0ABQ0GBY8_9PEZI
MSNNLSPSTLLTKPSDLPSGRSSPFFPEERGLPFFLAHKRLEPVKKRAMSTGGLRIPATGAFSFRRFSASSTSPIPSPTVKVPIIGTSSSAAPDAASGQEDTLLFPKVYEEAWGGADVSRTDLERARIFLLRIASMGVDPASSSTLRAIALDHKHNRTVPGLASAVQTSIYGNRHAQFDTTPLLQAVRFMLIKARVPENPFTQRARDVLDFFFDPTLHRNLNPPPPGELVRYAYPSGRLRVCIIGGGPTGLASAISLAEKGAGKVEVHVYERRWVVTENGTIDYPATARRRDQVVTLQDSVTSLLSPGSYQALFEGRPERVWPGSANIQIRKVEDRLLKRCQTDEFHGLIHLHAEGVTREELAAGKCGDFHVLLGTDGAASWVRKSYFRGYEKERGRSYALGLAFDRGSKGGLPWSQPLNMFLTLGQTRYLLNASDYDGRGYLNMQLTEDEWDKMVSVDGQPIHFGRPACLRRLDGSIPEGFDESRVFAPSEDRNSSLWKSIEDGLKLFGFKESEVTNVVRIPIVVQAVREGVQMLPLEDSRFVHRPHALVAVAGDAAMTVHFWPGRGLNSGIKAGIALGDEICHALRGGRFAGLELTAMKEYNDFIMKLQGREHDKRSIPILNQSGSPEMLGWLLSKAQSVPDEVAIEWLVGAMTQISDRLERRSDWAFPHEANIEPQIRIVLRQLHSLTLREMAVSFPWPTREMAGAEVLPIRSMRPEEKSKWLQQLWGMLTAEKNKETAAREKDRARSRGSSPSNARFEAPRPNKSRPKSPLQLGRSSSPQPPAPLVAPPVAQLETLSLNTSQERPPGSLRRSNAINNSRWWQGPASETAVSPITPDQPRRFSGTLSLGVPGSEFNREGGDGNVSYYQLTDGEGYMTGADEGRFRPRSPGFGVSSTSGGDVGLTRLLSIKRPTDSVLSDAMALALFRVDED